jgi:hypothetical protein
MTYAALVSGQGNPIRSTRQRLSFAPLKNKSFDLPPKKLGKKQADQQKQPACMSHQRRRTRPRPAVNLEERGYTDHAIPATAKAFQQLREIEAHELLPFAVGPLDLALLPQPIRVLDYA